MSELWVPRPERSRGQFNFFDIMLAMQEGLDRLDDGEKKISWARFSTVSLAKQLREIPPPHLNIELVTDLAIVDTHDEIHDGRRVEKIGILGTLDDVHCVSVSDKIPLSYSLSVKVIKTFSAHNESDSAYHLNRAIAPIRSVQYIETLAS